jgi:hypothetical protein
MITTSKTSLKRTVSITKYILGVFIDLIQSCDYLTIYLEDIKEEEKLKKYKQSLEYLAEIEIRIINGTINHISESVNELSEEISTDVLTSFLIKYGISGIEVTGSGELNTVSQEEFNRIIDVMATQLTKDSHQPLDAKKAELIKDFNQFATQSGGSRTIKRNNRKHPRKNRKYSKKKTTRRSRSSLESKKNRKMKTNKLKGSRKRNRNSKRKTKVI